MSAVYEKLGIRFEYPENWSLDEQDADEATPTISVLSPSGAFWSVMLHPPGTPPRALCDEALRVMQAEYDNLDVEPQAEMLFGYEMQGYELNFYCLDLTNTALIQSYAGPEGTYLVMCQAEDREFAKTSPVFRAITASLLA